MSIVTKLISNIFPDKSSTPSLPKEYSEFGSSHIVLTPEQYVKMFKQNRHSVCKAKILAPQIGKEDFGNFVIELQPSQPNSFELVDEQ